MAVDWLRHSCTYRAIYREGFFIGFVKSLTGRFHEMPEKIQLACLRGWLLFLGGEWLGHPSVEVREKLDSIDEESRLEVLVENLTNERLEIATWDELLASTEFPSTRWASSR